MSVWQRAEPTTVDPDLTEGLSARIADPLWMLARQWQSGEFRGEDAATPIFMRLEGQMVQIDRWQVGPTGAKGPVHTHDPQTPLEPIVEAEHHASGAGGARVGAESAHLLVALLRDVDGLDVAGRNRLVDVLRDAFPLRPDTSVERRDPAGERRLDALARRLFDGAAFAAMIVTTPGKALGLIAQARLSAAVAASVTAVITTWGRELGQVFVIPQTDTTWNPSRMEYEFRIGAPAGPGQGFLLESRDHGGGRLDWFTFDAVRFHPREDAGPPIVFGNELLPVPLTYPGQPASRFWEMEDGDVHYGGIDADITDMARVALAAYATVYSDDWYLVPVTVPSGHLVRITLIEVTDDFGDTTTVPAAAVLDGADRACRFFELTGDTSVERGLAPLLLVPPTVQAIDAGRPLDDVLMGRDEVANMAWAVERRVEGAYGRGIDPLAAVSPGGRRSAPPLEPGEVDDRWVFDLGGAVAGNWLPLLPVRLQGSEQIGLQRGRVPLPDEDRSRGALSTLLEPDGRLIIEESEVPRAGLRVQRRYQAARTPDGSLRVWLARQKGPGRPTDDETVATDVLRRP